MKLEQLDLIQRQIMDLVIDIQIHRSKKFIVDYDVSTDGNRLFVYIMEREVPMVAFDDGVTWLLDFNEYYDASKANDCLTSLACVLTDLEHGI